MRGLLLAGATLLLLPAALSSHGGGLDSNGCHTDRGTGEYHCHGTRTAQPPRAPAPSQRSSSSVQPLSSAGTISMAAPTATLRELTTTAQTLLAARGYRVEADGNVGPVTTQSIREFQRSADRAADGRVSGQLLIDLAQRVRTKLATQG
jgi:hypothetical protein